MTHQWFRMYAEALDDPKVQELPLKAFKFWVNFLCFYCKNSHKSYTEVTTKEIGFALRLRAKDVESCVKILTEIGLLDESPNGYKPHNWLKRQYQSDNSTERVKRFRNGEKPVSCNGDETVNETPPDTDTEQNRTEIPPNPPQAGGFKNSFSGSRADGTNPRAVAKAAAQQVRVLTDAEKAENYRKLRKSGIVDPERERWLEAYERQNVGVRIQ